MNPPNPQQFPHEYEREMLPAIIEKAKAYDARYKQFHEQAKRQGLTTAEMEAFGQELRQWESYFRQFEPEAQILAQANLPAMRQWLDWVLHDMPDLQRIHDEMYRDRVAADTKVTKILADSNEEIQRKLNEISKSQRQATQSIIGSWKP